MLMVREGEPLPEKVICLVMVSAQEARWLEGQEERKRFVWLRRLRRRAAKTKGPIKLEFIRRGEMDRMDGMDTNRQG